jgi:hypothetical protein
MSTLEILLVGLAVAGAATYLVRRFWRRFRGSGGGCGGCPVAHPKIRLAVGDRRDSSSHR